MHMVRFQRPPRARGQLLQTTLESDDPVVVEGVRTGYQPLFDRVAPSDRAPAGPRPSLVDEEVASDGKEQRGETLEGLLAAAFEHAYERFLQEIFGFGRAGAEQPEVAPDSALLALDPREQHAGIGRGLRLHRGLGRACGLHVRMDRRVCRNSAQKGLLHVSLVRNRGTTPGAPLPRQSQLVHVADCVPRPVDPSDRSQQDHQHVRSLPCRARHLDHVSLPLEPGPHHTTRLPQRRRRPIGRWLRPVDRPTDVLRRRAAWPTGCVQRDRVAPRTSSSATSTCPFRPRRPDRVAPGRVSPSPSLTVTSTRLHSRSRPIPPRRRPPCSEAR